MCAIKLPSNMLSLVKIVCIIIHTINVVYGEYNGPYLLWGIDSLKSVESSALAPIDDKILRDLYAEPTSIVMFLRNGTGRLNKVNYPKFKQLIDTEQWLYLAQNYLTSDPMDFNSKSEVIHLVGPTSQQDIEMTALYKDAVATYGRGKVMGILATKWDDHDIRKREVDDITASPISPTDEPMQEDFTYIATGKAILYTTSAPVLKMPETNTSTDDESTTYELRSHGLVTVDDRDQLSRLIVSFRTDEKKFTLRFRFTIASGYWSLGSVEVEELTRTYKLAVVDDPPTAPIGFSHKCGRSLVFQNGSITLTLENVQVQPLLAGSTQFGDAYDCVGFTTAPIWSGIFVTSIFLVVLTIAITAILDIKTPNRFENSRGKQLTFTIQE